MLPPSSTFEPFVIQVAQVSRLDRWSVHQRLEELMISSWCPEDGSLHVKIENSLAAVLVHGIVRRFVAPRHELVDWLERCWQQSLKARD